MAHACTHRVYLRKGRANTRLVRVIDSPYLPEEKIRIAITEAGVTDEDGSYPEWSPGEYSGEQNLELDDELIIGEEE